MKDKFVSILLTIVLIALLGIIGFCGYIIYNEIMGDETEYFNIEEAGYPTEETSASSSDTRYNSSNSNLFSGISDGKNNNTTSLSTTVGRNLYNQLGREAKIIYSKLYENKENLETGTYTIEFKNTFSDLLSKEDGDKELKKQYQSAIEAFLYENPDVFYLDVRKMYINIEKITKITGVKYNVYINHGNKDNYFEDGIYSKADVDKCQEEIEIEKNKILARVEGKSKYDAIKEVHDYLADTIMYQSSTTDESIYTIYGALVNKRCVCEGYAKSFQYMMNLIGIENAIVIGTGTNSQNETESHAWNYVELDGKWYGIDVTWDDPVILGKGKLTKNLRYQYFLKGEKTMSKNHTVSGTFTEGGQVFQYPTLSQEDYE